MSTKKRVAILISGRGSNMAALIDAAALPDFPAEIVGVISNRPDAKGLAIAAAKGVSTSVIPSKGVSREEHDAALYHWIDGVAKRTAWEAVFGDYVEGMDHNAVARRLFGRDDPDGSLLRGAGLMDQDNRVFSPNAKYHQQMDVIKAEHGSEAARDVQQMVDGALGRHGRQMPPFRSRGKTPDR